MDQLKPGVEGSRVRIGPLEYYEIAGKIEHLHAMYGGINHYVDTSSFGFGGYRGGMFRVRPLIVEDAMYMLDIELPNNQQAFEAWLLLG